MLPIFVSTVESDKGRGDSGRRNLKITLLGLVAMLAFGIVLLFSGSIAASVAGVFAVVIAIITLAVMGVQNVAGGNDIAKRKRGLDGLDMYSLIDRMVDDLDGDELAYLRRRLEQKDDALPQQVANLLDYREEERQAGRR